MEVIEGCRNLVCMFVLVASIVSIMNLTCIPVSKSDAFIHINLWINSLVKSTSQKETLVIKEWGI